MWHTGLDEAQIGIKISGRNVHNLRYTDDTTLIAQSEWKVVAESCKYAGILVPEEKNWIRGQRRCLFAQSFL